MPRLLLSVAAGKNKHHVKCQNKGIKWNWWSSKFDQIYESFFTAAAATKMVTLAFLLAWIRHGFGWTNWFFNGQAYESLQKWRFVNTHDKITMCNYVTVTQQFCNAFVYMFENLVKWLRHSARHAAVVSSLKNKPQHVKNWKEFESFRRKAKYFIIWLQTIAFV